jgi:hypothetical protein
VVTCTVECAEETAVLRSRILLLALCTPFLAAHPQAVPSPPTHAVELSLLSGPLDYGTYFTGPGGIRFSNENGFAYGGQFSVRVWRNLSVVGAVLHGNSNWSFEEVPLVGSVTLNGAKLWFFDLGPRVTVPLGSGVPVALIAQATFGAIHYAVDNPLFVGDTPNLAFGGGAGLAVRLGRRARLQVLVKDYVASFRSVKDAEFLGVEGQRSHTVALLVGLGVGF